MHRLPETSEAFERRKAADIARWRRNSEEDPRERDDRQATAKSIHVATRDWLATRATALPTTARMTKAARDQRPAGLPLSAPGRRVAR
jgi:hypothetical protein